MTDPRKTIEDDFARQAEEAQPGVLGELWDFLRHNKKWWLTPIVVVLVFVGLLALFSTSAAAPLIYTLF